MAPWVFETNSGFRVKSRGIGLVCGLRGSLLVLADHSFWLGGAGHWAIILWGLDLKLTLFF